MRGAALPARGLAWGDYPEREPKVGLEGLRDAARTLRTALTRREGRRLPTVVARAIAHAEARLTGADARTFDRAVASIRGKLRLRGLEAQVAGFALGCAGAAMARTLGKTPYETQYQAAWLLLQGRFVEMATGEGKTLAAALAGAVAALGRVPVHLLTANDYLVGRDAAELAPFYGALGVTVAHVLPALDRDQRAAAYAADVTYVTAKELVFDYLRDHLQLQSDREPLVLRARAMTEGERLQPVLPGLCYAIIDEADSILLDEACVPLILSSVSPAWDEAAFRRADAIAAALEPGADFRVWQARRRAILTERGEALVLAACASAAGELSMQRRARELVELSLTARHAYRRDRDYIVANDAVGIIDEVTGRIAEGRQWSGGLHQMVEIREGVKTSPMAVTVAQITYQRFFPRYLRLAGLSGTLVESRRELAVLFGATVSRVPLAKPSRRRWLGERLFTTGHKRWAAVIERVREMIAAGRPVLVGTDSVAASEHLSALLRGLGIAHQVLNARQDADEARRIADAGEPAMVTVSTNLAGRGTDIRLAPGVATAGGLHVIACMRNRSRRIDRQLSGRAARHGDPGSAEGMVALDDLLVTRGVPRWILSLVKRGCRSGTVPAFIAWPLLAIAQRLSEVADFQQRRQLRLADRRARQAFGVTGGME